MKGWAARSFGLRRLWPLFGLAFGLAFLGLSAGCSNRSAGLSESLRLASSSLEGPLHLTWYLSDKMRYEPAAVYADGILAAFAKAAGGVGAGVTAVVRPPLPGESRPAALGEFNLPGGAFFPFYNGLVLDGPGGRAVVPDLNSEAWLEADLVRAVEDLAAGGLRRIFWLDARGGNLDDVLGGLSGRWEVVRWGDGMVPGRRDVLVLRDGPLLNDPALRAAVEIHLQGGGGLLMVPAESYGPESDLGEWAAGRAPDESQGHSVFLEDPALLGGDVPMRDLDLLLLFAANALGPLAALPEDGVLELKSRRLFPKKAGRRLQKAAPGRPFAAAVDPDDVDSLEFESGGTGFSLERQGDLWVLRSEDWVLPARRERVETFLERLAAGAAESWVLDSGAEPGNGLNVGLLGRGRRLGGWSFYGMRREGGGALVSAGGKSGVLPLVYADELSGDARYWMDLRLFPEPAEILRAELQENGLLRWRLHESADRWILEDGSLGREVLDAEEADAFLGKVLLLEARTLVPAGVGDEGAGPLVLELETRGGRKLRYELLELPGGGIAALSAAGGTDAGILYVLDSADSGVLLEGPF